jgi:hypothetical protein
MRALFRGVLPKRGAKDTIYCIIINILPKGRKGALAVRGRGLRVMLCAAGILLLLAGCSAAVFDPAQGTPPPETMPTPAVQGTPTARPQGTPTIRPQGT